MSRMSHEKTTVKAGPILLFRIKEPVEGSVCKKFTKYSQKTVESKAAEILFFDQLRLKPCN